MGNWFNEWFDDDGNPRPVQIVTDDEPSFDQFQQGYEKGDND
jgi:hypothetical protein